MLRRQKEIRAQVQKVLDAGLFGLALWLTHWLRSEVFQFAVLGGTHEIPPFDEFIWLFLTTIFVAPFILETQGFYSRPSLNRRRLTLWQLFKTCVIAEVLLIVTVFLMKDYPARSVIILFGPVAFALVYLKEELMRSWMRSKLGQSQSNRQVILVGTAGDAARLQEEMRKSGSEAVRIAATLDLNTARVEELVELLHEHSANAVVLNAKHTIFGQVEKAIQACELEGVEAWLLADFFNTQVSQTTLDEFNGRPTLVFRSTPEDSWQKLAKQTLDVLGALLFLTAFSWAFVLVAILIRITSPGPVLFRQTRSGLNGKPFTMLKFRSMVTDAEQLKVELQALNEMEGPVFKLTNDPRVTPIGRFIRRWSIDEWPQMLNVLLGDMSLVGPRPLPVDEVRRFDELSHRRRLSVKPGLTCLWQVNGRNQVTSFKDWVRLDLEYIDNWSFWLDLKILARTIPVVLLGTGAK